MFELIAKIIISLLAGFGGLCLIAIICMEIGEWRDNCKTKRVKKLRKIVKSEIDSLNIKSDINSRLGNIPHEIKQSEEKILGKLKASCFKK